MICAAPGHVLIGADFSAIESRVLAWVAGEEWKLDSYRRFDATHDPRDEPYCVTACKIFRVPDGTFTKESPERSVGKTCDLAFGYMGGLGAWRKFEPDKFTDEEVEKFKTEWRAAHPRIVEVLVRHRPRRLDCRARARPCRALRPRRLQMHRRIPAAEAAERPQDLAIRSRASVVERSASSVVVFADNAAGQFTDCRHGQGAYGGMDRKHRHRHRPRSAG